MLIKDSIIPAVSPLSPVFRLKALCTSGESSIKPIKPITTEGNPASNSIMGFMISLTLLGATSER